MPQEQQKNVLEYWIPPLLIRKNMIIFFQLTLYKCMHNITYKFPDTYKAQLNVTLLMQIKYTEYFNFCVVLPSIIFHLQMKTFSIFVSHSHTVICNYENTQSRYLLSIIKVSDTSHSVNVFLDNGTTFIFSDL